MNEQKAWRSIPVRLLDALAAILAVSAVLAAIVIAVSEPMTLDLSAEGFRFLLEMFRFPIAAAAGAVGVVTLRLTGESVLIGRLQRRAASQATLQRDLDHHVETTTISAPGKDGDLSEVPFPRVVAYGNRSETLKRLYDLNTWSGDAAPEVNGALRVLVGAVATHWEKMKALMEDGDVRWLAEFVGLCVAARKLRLYLIVGTPGMEEWNHVPVLEQHGEFGQKRMPGYEGITFTTIAGCVRLELLCAAHALYFAGPGFGQPIYDVALGVGSIWHEADSETKPILEEQLDRIWNEEHRLDHRRIQF